MQIKRVLLRVNRSYFCCKNNISISSKCYNKDGQVNGNNCNEKFPRLDSGGSVNYKNNFKRSYTTTSCLGPLLREELSWRAVVSEAERMVGYPTSFLNLRWLFNDEIAVAATQLRKLVGTNHPLLKSAKNILIGSKSNLQSVGLIVLLVSKAAGFNPAEFSQELHTSGVLHAQRALAEIVEMKRTGHIIHKTMANLQEKEKHGKKYDDLLCGNKIVLLTGDYLLAKCLAHLGGLRNNAVTELISTGLRDLVEGDFLGETDVEGNHLPTKPKGGNEIIKRYDWESENNLGTLGSNDYLGRGIDEWKLRTMLTSGSLLAKGCQAAMKLSKQSEEMEREAYKLGGHLAMIWQLYLDVKDFYTHPHSYSMVGAPVIIALWEYPTIYGHIYEAKLEKKGVEIKQLHYAVRSTRAIEYLRIFLDHELDAVLRCTDMFPVEDARHALHKMAISIHGEAVEFLEK
ncbi:all trans-polyprenyl-diphosphate synthase PDSS2 [Papilio machaon]|uniref:all trans-polyprenyl-diphosphate synthase PDSS2 n=1 Tax=Papilio machaon TaxID=76193 RepID=UPI001E662FE0|nr:all trans-polyprenyl-diphosphate synthase PDSS2 [Papilio machaon]